MTREDVIELLKKDKRERGNSFIGDALDIVIKMLEQEPCTLDDARKDFVFDVYNILDFLPTNNEANQIIDVFDRVTSGLEQEPKTDVLDKIRAEIEQTEINGYIRDVECFRAGINVALNIINKYKVVGE